ncbi:MAG: DUF1611 domain-containing protein [Gemmatimonadota bacterium]|nr:DUF1611 domain-containing protein [Gemmatimonadota bacterium]
MTPRFPEGSAIVYCEGAFGTPNGKTAHGLVRRTRRYELICIVDSRHRGSDAGAVLDGVPNQIPVVGSLDEAVAAAVEQGRRATHFVIGLAPDGGRLPGRAREVVADALRRGLNVDSGLHDFLSEDPDLAALARDRGVAIRDVRRPPERADLHFFTGEIENVTSTRVAVLGTDSAVGKRTTAWKIVEGLEARGRSVEMIGTGQTAWMQGVGYGVLLDSLVNDFVSGEIEHAICTAFEETRPDFMVLEGQGALMNPAYPGGFELLAAGRPHAVILQHAPRRLEYDGFPGYPIQPLHEQIQAIQMISGRPVVALTLNHEGMTREEIPAACTAMEAESGLPTVDALFGDLSPILDCIEALSAGVRS